MRKLLALPDTKTAYSKIIFISLVMATYQIASNIKGSYFRTQFLSYLDVFSLLFISLAFLFFYMLYTQNLIKNINQKTDKIQQLYLDIDSLKKDGTVDSMINDYSNLSKTDPFFNEKVIKEYDSIKEHFKKINDEQDQLNNAADDLQYVVTKLERYVQFLRIFGRLVLYLIFSFIVFKIFNVLGYENETWLSILILANLSFELMSLLLESIKIIGLYYFHIFPDSKDRITILLAIFGTIISLIALFK